MPATAFAQSTGTVDDRRRKRNRRHRHSHRHHVDGIAVPDTTKAKALITQELIAKQAPGNTILNVVNLVPGVNFTQSDPFGSAGGNIRIRGFDGNRISLTFDGVPLNDSGNYAIFSNQQLDPELVDQINVGLGVTDVDSPDRIGGRRHDQLPDADSRKRNRRPRRRLARRFRLSSPASAWSRPANLRRSAPRRGLPHSFARNDKFKGPGEIDKQQYNARIYQPLGSSGDFISIAGHYNENRNNFYRNPSVNDLRSIARLRQRSRLSPNASASADDPIKIGYHNDDQWDTIFDFENLDYLQPDHPGPGTGAQNDNRGRAVRTVQTQLPATDGSTRTIRNTSSCTNLFDVRINPSNTGNIRGQSRFTLADNLILTVDPSFQYVLANGGGISALAENSARARGANPLSSGVDFNGDGDFVDTRSLLHAEQHQHAPLSA